MKSAVALRFQAGLLAQREQADARIFWLLVAQWAVILSTSIAMANRWQHSRLGTLSSAVVWVGVLCIVPLAMVVRFPGRWQTRWTVMASQGLMSTLLWFVAGGRPDTHLHLFAWLVVLALYRDIPLLVSMVAVTLTGHAVVYSCCTLPALPEAGVTHWTPLLFWMAWMVGENAFLCAFVLLDRQALSAKTEREQALESLQSDCHRKFEEVTRQLIDERDELKHATAALAERQSSLETARLEASQELATLRRNLTAESTALLKLASRQVDSSVNAEWRSHWHELRKQARQLIRLASIESVDERETPAPTYGEQSDASGQQRAMLLMRNPLQQAGALTAIESAGYKVDVMANGPRTYYSVMLNDYSLIVVDIDLPGEEGFDTLEALGLLPRDRQGKSRSLFAVTASPTPDRVLRCIDLGVDRLFKKPLSPEELRQGLAETRKTARRRRAVAAGNEVRPDADSMQAAGVQ